MAEDVAAWAVDQGIFAVRGWGAGGWWWGCGWRREENAAPFGELKRLPLRTCCLRL
ncbi:hypothetical protein BCAR13_490042 [Paraburkholderia caribensis]|nr:hypothetical protein BCAR13_490042 [Paraburkholderia caribensis]